MNIVRLWGGLGNQLFQYGFGKYLLNIRKENVIFFSQSKMPEISFLAPSVKISSEEGVPVYWKNPNPYHRRVQRKVLQKFPLICKNIFVEDELTFKEELPKNAKIFDGYWQSYRYLKNIEPEIRKSISFDGINMGVLRAINDIKDTNSVSIHIRRGDYLKGKNKKIFCECDYGYYKFAIETLIQKYNDLSFFVFSNDTLWVKQNYDFSDFADTKFSYVINDGELNGAMADLYLMSLCKHNIIANSTFSWWGGWLNSNPEKVVIAPKYWYRGKRNRFTKDLIPPCWLRL